MGAGAAGAPKLNDGPCERDEEKSNPVAGFAGCANILSAGFAGGAAPNTLPLFVPVEAAAPNTLFVVVLAEPNAGAVVAPKENPVLGVAAGAAGVGAEAPKLNPPVAAGLD